MSTPYRPIKICGITSVDDAKMVCDAGVSAIGLVFCDKSPRNISIQQAETICAAVSPFVKIVGLFLNEKADFVTKITDNVQLDLLQFHGNESAEFCSSFSRPYIKAIGMGSIDQKNNQSIDEIANQHKNALGILLDSNETGKIGGTGHRFDWNSISSQFTQPIILAGGINPENIRAALALSLIHI